MKKYLKYLLILALATLTACSLPGMGENKSNDDKQSKGQTTDGEVYELKISTSQTETALITKSYQKFAEKVEENSNGRIKVTVFPASQLGNDEDVIEQAVQGAAIAVNTDAARMGTYVKDMGIMMMGYFADNYDECNKVTESETFKTWTDQLAKENGIRVLSFNFYDGPRHFMVNKEINTPEDLKGQRIRTIGADVCTKSIEAMGATPVAMAWGEVYNGIQSKAIDGCEAQNTSTLPSRIYEVCKYQIKTGHFQLLQGLVCGEKWFDTLPEDLQEVLVNTAKEVGKESAEEVVKETEKAEEEMKNAGLTIIEPDLKPFKDACDKAYDEMGYTELREKIYKEIGKTK